jgi:homoserine dehydrogenase
LRQNRTVKVAIVGLGGVGTRLLRQMLDLGKREPPAPRVELLPVVLADVSACVYDTKGLSRELLGKILQAKAKGFLLDSLTESRSPERIADAIAASDIVVDSTASPNTVPLLESALSRKVGIVLANKTPLAAPWPIASGFLSSPFVRYEVTVGAGLPVIGTIRYLLGTGDRMVSVEGCLSGTLGFLCAELERGTAYSTALRHALALGYTEPDPREDLSGRDVARKALILARTAGWPLEMSDVEVEPLCPESAALCTTDEFMMMLPTLDSTYEERFKAARAGGKSLRYVATMGPRGARVGLTAVSPSSHMGALRGPANHVAIHTRRYSEIPLALTGPGAGVEVTAAGVLGDILHLAHQSDFARGREIGLASQ